jgi:putative ABC transport system substrate-binding protein
MKRTIFGFTLSAMLYALCSIVALLFALCLPAQALQAKKVPRIGVLISASAAATAPFIDALQQGLHELGYVEGKTIAIERRFAELKFDRLPNLATELVRLKVDVIVPRDRTLPSVLPGKQPARSQL